jgi:hypothetical protein
MPLPYRVAPALLFLAVASLPQNAEACACCAEPGARHLQTRALEDDDYYRDELNLIALDGPAHTYVTACDLDCTKGMGAADYSYTVSLTRTADDWHLDLTGSTGQSAGLSFALPNHYTYFAVDTDPRAERPMVPLYKEFRFDITATGSGEFAKGLPAGTPAHFILSGIGNECTSASDFTHWRFDVNTETAEFALFGNVTSPGPAD